MAPIINSLAGCSSRAYGQGAGGALLVPQGLIVPYATSDAIPTGWAAFSDADGLYLVGAGSTYTGGETSATGTDLSVSGTMSSTGSHSPGGQQCKDGGGGGYSNNSAGSHDHTFSGTLQNRDVYKDFRLIKSTASDLTTLPANALLLGTTSLSDLTNVENSVDKFLRGNSSYGGEGGSASLTASVSSSSAGSHTHGGSYQYAGSEGGGCQYYWNSGGNHSHGFAASGSLATKRMYMSAWTNASEEFDLVNEGIAMWESATPPDGWDICDGTNGTPDCRDYFIRLGTTANHGTTSGNNSVSWTLSQTSFSSSHDHFAGGCGSCAYTYGNHNSYSWSHTHTLSAYNSGTNDFVPPYCALYFIRMAA